MGNIRKIHSEMLPSFGKTWKKIVDDTGFMLDSLKAKKTLTKIHYHACKSYQHSINPDDVVKETAVRLGIQPDEDPEIFLFIMIVVGSMSSFLLSKIITESKRLEICIYQINGETDQKPQMDYYQKRLFGSSPSRDRLKCHDLYFEHRLAKRRHDRYLPGIQHVGMENPLWPTFVEVVASVSSSHLKELMRDPEIQLHVEMIYEEIQLLFEKSGIVPDFSEVKEMLDLNMNENAVLYSVSWFVWHTISTLQKKINGEMKIVVNSV
jgi:hypothetical protein